MKFSTKLILSILIATLIFVPLLGFGIFNSARLLLQKSISQNQMTLTRHMMGSVDRTLFTAYQGIQIIADDKIVEEYFHLISKEESTLSIKTELKNKILDKKMLLTGPWDSIFFVSRVGMINSLDFESEEQHISTMPINKLAFDGAMQGKIYYSDLILPDDSTRPTILFAAPVYDESLASKPILGVVIGYFSWFVILQKLNEINPVNNVYLFNYMNFIIATPPIYRDKILANKLEEFSQVKKENPDKKQVSAVISSKNVTGETALVSYFQQQGYLSYKGNDWTLMIESPLERSLFSVNQLAKDFVFLLTFIMSLLILVFYWIGMRLTRPIETLTRTVKLMSQGNTNYRALVQGDDEVTELATSFNKMVDHLRQTTVSKIYVDNIIQSMTDTLIVLKPDGVISSVNLATLRLLKYQEHELVDNPMSVIMSETGQKNEFLNTHWLERLKSRGFIKAIEVNFKTKYGRKVSMLVSSSAMWENEKIEGIVFVGKDITSRKKVEEKIKKANEELKVANRHLKDSQIKLLQSAKLASVGELATGVAHEINQPLSIISMNSELQIKKISKGNFNQAIESFEIIISQVNRASSIINHLKTFGRESSTLDRSRHDINQIIQDSFIMVNQKLRLHNIEVLKELAKNLPHISCNSIQVEQVLINLIMNAIDAMNKSSIKTLTVRSLLHCEMVVVEIEDTGLGILPSLINKVFDPFFTQKPLGEGTGLGLSISYGIIKAHNGYISVSSLVGEGATFRIEIPTQGGLVS